MNVGQHIFEGILLAGLAGAVYLYGFAFDDFSETELVWLSYLWLSALVFGTHGLLASELSALVASGAAATTREAVALRGKEPNRTLLSKFASLALPTLLLLTTERSRRSPTLAALLATALSMGALAFFFAAIFPSL